jgi:uncharacterized cupredoxin-like copper-binding protein
MQSGRVLVLGGSLLMSVGLLAGCGSSSKSSNSTATTTTVSGGATFTLPAAAGTTINVALNDTQGVGGPMTLTAVPATAPAGKITFVVKNTGTIDHEMVALKLNSGEKWNALPVTDAGDPPVKVTSGANKVAETNDEADTGDPNLKPGETRTITATLTAGSYALVCNIALHYGRGMRASFTVTP